MAAKKTMSVREMQEMLGLGKTDSYWLVHKRCFETILVEGKMRIVIESFEKWYANQTKHKKVDGPPPGEELKEMSYSVREAAELLGIDEASFYYLLHRDQIPTFQAECWTRIRKEDFDRWYRSQEKHRTQEDRERDAELEAATISMPEMARELGVPRSVVYNLLKSAKNKGRFETITLAGQRRVTRESYEAWYAEQGKYVKLTDRPQEEQVASLLAEKVKEAPRLEVNPNKASYSVEETAVLMDVSVKEVYELIRSGDLEAKKYGYKYMVFKEEIDWWLIQQRLHAEAGN